MNFYTSVDLRGKNVLYRGWRNGCRVHEAIPFCPTLYIKSKQPTGLTTIYGNPVEAIDFESVHEAREFIEKYKDVSNFEVYGNTGFVYQYLYREFPHEVDYDFSRLRIAFLDIETSCDGGFPSPENPTERIIAITLTVGKNTYVLGLGDFALEGVEAECFADEESLLRRFVEIWKHEDPDIVTGWNIRFFDIPYLVTRMNWIADEWANALSPWGRLREMTVNRMGRDQQVFTIGGISTLDYLELYMKFTYVKQESYSLNHVCSVELGEEKVSYSEYETLQEFYTQNFQKFMEYNYKDVELVAKLEEKLKLLDLAVALAYSARVNFEDVFSQVRTWDAIIHHHLMGKGMVVPQKREAEKKEQYAGAYVKDPLVGMHDWVVSFDLNSLYPHLIMQYNISPETKDKNPIWGRNNITPDSILSRNRGEPVKTLIDPAEYLNDGKRASLSVAANGVAFRKDRHGFLPELMETMYEERKRYKELMLGKQKELEALPPDAPASQRKAIEYDISKYKNFQMVRKIQLNSAYGAIGNEYFRFFDVALAEAITLSGQLSIQWIGEALNRYLNKLFKTEGQDYVIASDTDSVYLRLGDAVKQGFKTTPEPQKAVEFLDKFCERVLQPFIEKEFTLLANIMNAYSNKMFMGREVIAQKGVWTAKKRYMLSVWNSEGVQYKTPKFKIMGIETTRSSTPAYVRKALKKAVEMVLLKDESTLQEFVKTTREEFKGLPPEAMAFPRSVNGMGEYKDLKTVYRKSTPIAVKAALLHNQLVHSKGLGKKYRSIGEGEKIKFIYLRTPNPIHEHVIGFTSSLPPEFELQKYVDWELQFDKSFLEPLRSITNSVGWKTEQENTLESLFV